MSGVCVSIWSLFSRFVVDRVEIHGSSSRYLAGLLNMWLRCSSTCIFGVCACCNGAWSFCGSRRVSVCRFGRCPVGEWLISSRYIAFSFMISGSDVVRHVFLASALVAMGIASFCGSCRVFVCRFSYCLGSSWLISSKYMVLLHDIWLVF